MTAKKQLSREQIRALRGKYKFSTDGRPFAEWMSAWKHSEIELEEAKL